MTPAMASELAQRRVNDFRQRCGEYSEAALHLAYHAALPVALNAELLHLLRINFFLDPPEPLPYTVEFEFLLSPLCREIDEGLYEIEPEIRDVLLAGLTQTYDAQRSRDIATLLWQYVDHHSPWADRMELERAQQLTALNFLDPEKAQQWLAKVETNMSKGRGAAREWFVAMRQDIENQAQLLQDSTSEETQRLSELPTKDFFISYTAEDREWAEWIAWVLEETGHSVVIQAWDFRLGSNFVLDMQRTAAEAQKTIVLLSESYLQSAYAQLEWAAFASDLQSQKRQLIPIRVRECKPTGILKAMLYVDLVGLSETEAQQRLLAAVKGQEPEQKTLVGRVPFPGVAESTTTEESEQILAILERIVQHQQTEQDLEMLRRALPADSGVQWVSEDGKFNANVGEITKGEVRIGDRIYHGVDAKAIRVTLLEILKSLQPNTQPIGIPTNLPYSGVVEFVGRDAVMSQLHQMLQQNHRVAVSAITGMGGVGKTELALQYALKYQPTYPAGICWLSARGVDVGTQIVQFGRSLLGLNPPEDVELVEQVTFCWRHWQSGEVLLVFDDVTDYAAIKPYLPPSTAPRFNVLITTRLRLGASVKQFKLDVLDQSAALALLESLVGSERIQTELDCAKQLCAQLGYLPLGLEWVGRYLARKPELSLAAMQQRLQDDRRQDLRQLGKYNVNIGQGQDIHIGDHNY
jgi:hypothetical protein